MANHDAAPMTSLAAVPDLCLDDCLKCWLQSRLEVVECRGTLDLVDSWADDRTADGDDLPDFLASRGAFCDCEVLLNGVLDERLVLDDLVLSCGR